MQNGHLIEVSALNICAFLTNLSFNTMREAAGRMVEGGRIVNFSSSVIELGLPGYSIYGATKAAVETMTQIFAKERLIPWIHLCVVTEGGPVDRERWDGGQIKLSTFIPLKIRKRGASKVVVRSDGLAHHWQCLLDEGRFSSMTEIAAAEGIDLGQASKMSRLAQLAPDLIEAIALGRLEVGVSQLLRGKLSASWLAQREALVAGSR